MVAQVPFLGLLALFLRIKSISLVKLTREMVHGVRLSNREMSTISQYVQYQNAREQRPTALIDPSGDIYAMISIKCIYFHLEAYIYYRCKIIMSESYRKFIDVANDKNCSNLASKILYQSVLFKLVRMVAA